ncbi:MAG: septation protein IspZ [Leptospiraceae bacterium]|nr:septation protein IspZ [Leptospiraceae bacterium]MCK6381168.1 septation protein IspZ [Leptospiraceae bacterium]NUM40856.1 septation protein IspZ [Leptospiraceae bacterium]
MNSNLWIGIIPVLVFVVLESFTNKKMALLSALALAVAELIFTIVVYKTIDEITILGFFLIGVAVFLSLKTENDIYFKLQPAILGWILALVFFFFYYVLNRFLLNEMFHKYMGDSFQNILEQTTDPEFLENYLKLLSKYMGWLFFIHGTLTGYAAFKLNKWWWFIIRVPGLYILMIVFSILAMRGVL